MTRILVTGGTGVLGSRVVSQLLQQGDAVRIMSRNAQPTSAPQGVEWVQAELETGRGLREAVAGVEVIVHAASSPMMKTKEVDIDGTQTLLQHAKAAGVGHFLYISIVGIDRVPYPYYQAKVATEAVVAASGVAWSSLRITQFHSFIDFMLQNFYGKFPLGLLPSDWQFQPIDEGEAAAQVIAAAKGQPGGLLPDVGGPEVLRLGEMVKQWRRAHGYQRLFVPIYVPGKVAHAIRHGFNTCPDHRQGKITWVQWLAQHYTAKTVHQGTVEYGRQAL